MKNPYKARPIRFLGIRHSASWNVKMYSISIQEEFVNERYRLQAEAQLEGWLRNSENHGLENYGIATLILHECKEGCFAILSRWTDENMLQSLVFLWRSNDKAFHPYANNEIVSCVWELEVHWFERNAWIEHVLKNVPNPDYTAYLNHHFTTS